MKNLVILTEESLKAQINFRSKETKFGEHIKLITLNTSIYEALKDLDVSHVIFGIKEDIGVFANYGKTGAAHTWDNVLKNLVNIQSNVYTKPNRVAVLGHLDFSEELLICQKLKSHKKKDIKQARELVNHIDIVVSQVVFEIIKAGKIPIIIGGGHNNAYGNIKGASLAFNKRIGAVNLDVHSDFRAEEGRHSGNGFSYAYAEGFLKKYVVLGLQENYVSTNVLKLFKSLKKLKFISFEALEVRAEITFEDAMEDSLKHLGESMFGIELDCDAIADISSSAITPSGFTVKQARQYIRYFGRQNNGCYLHIAEGIATTDNNVAKLISFFITDFIKAKPEIN